MQDYDDSGYLIDDSNIFIELIELIGFLNFYIFFFVYVLIYSKHRAKYNDRMASTWFNFHRILILLIGGVFIFGFSLAMPVIVFDYFFPVTEFFSDYEIIDIFKFIIILFLLYKINKTGSI